MTRSNVALTGAPLLRVRCSEGLASPAQEFRSNGVTVLGVPKKVGFRESLTGMTVSHHAYRRPLPLLMHHTLALRRESDGTARTLQLHLPQSIADVRRFRSPGVLESAREHEHAVVPFEGDECRFTAVLLLEVHGYALSVSRGAGRSRVREERDLYGIGTDNLPPVWKHRASRRVSEEACGRDKAMVVSLAYDCTQWFWISHEQEQDVRDWGIRLHSLHLPDPRHCISQSWRDRKPCKADA